MWVPNIFDSFIPIIYTLQFWKVDDYSLTSRLLFSNHYNNMVEPWRT